MKKRLLITSIVMMLVVAVALSTATYAWFTSNVQVTANTITMTAGTSQSSALGIEWTASNQEAGDPLFNAHYTTDIDSVAPATYITTLAQAGGFQPAAPVLLDTISDQSAPVFKTAFVNAQGEFKSNGNTTEVYRFANYENAAAATSASDTYSNLIHVANLAQSGSQTLYLTASITQHFEATTAVEIANTATYTYYNANKEAITPTNGEALGAAGYKVETAKDGSALVRIAVYEVTGTSPSEAYTYKGLLGKTAAVDGDEDGNPDPNTVEGAIEIGDDAIDLITACTTTELNLGSIAAQSDKAYAIYVWLDGAAFDEAQSLKTADISLTFSTAKVSGGAVAEING